jgi:cytochrome c peroxidase
MKKLNLVLSGLLVASVGFAGENLILKAKNAGLKPIPQSKLALLKIVDDPNNPMTDLKIDLGKKLYFDPRLSKSGIISCNTCHNLGLGGVDGISAATGHKWRANPHHLNSPTVYNSVLNSAQFWDGRAAHLEDQAQGPMQAAPEMASPAKVIAQKINSIPKYVDEFKKAYGENVKITFKLVADTIGVFERTLITPSRYDDFLNGHPNALSKTEKEGLNLFIDKGCASCHNNIGVGGTMQPFEVANKYKFENVGDFRGNKNGMVKTPTLRNIEETAPYFHNGMVWNLKDAVKDMGSIQLGLKISNKDADKIVVFLKSLTGRKPNISYPQLPASTNKTPKPNLN